LTTEIHASSPLATRAGLRRQQVYGYVANQIATSRLPHGSSSARLQSFAKATRATAETGSAPMGST
jgi:hypothetical protein